MTTPLIDDQGRILGRVNVIDLALAVALAVVVLAASRQALLFPGDAQVHVQVEATDVPRALAASLVPGARTVDGSAEVTDVAVFPTSADRAQVLAKVRLVVERLEHGSRYHQDYVAPGTGLTLRFPAGALFATVGAVGEGPRLALVPESTPSILGLRGVPAWDAALLRAGVLLPLGGDAFFRVDHVTVVPRDFTVVDAYLVGMRQVPLRGEGASRPAGDPALTLRLPGGAIQASPLGPAPGGSPVAARLVDVRIETAPGATTAPIVGDAAVVAGQTLSEVRDALELRRSGSVAWWVDLAVLAAEVGGSFEYHGAPLGTGTAVRHAGTQGVLAGDAVTLLPVEGAWTEARMVARGVPATRADRVVTGVQETTLAGAPVLEVLGVERTSAADGQDLELWVRLLAGPGPSFKGAPLATGAMVWIAPGGAGMAAEVISVSEGGR